jgi:hypothetical protein
MFRSYYHLQAERDVQQGAKVQHYECSVIDDEFYGSLKKWSLPNYRHQTYKFVTLTGENYSRLDVQTSRYALTPLTFTPIS